MYYINYVGRRRGSSPRQFTRKFKTIDEIVKFNMAPGTSVRMITNIKSYLTPHQQQLYKSKMNACLMKKIEKTIKEEQEILGKYTISKISPSLSETRVLSTGTVDLQISDNISTIITELTGLCSPELNESVLPPLISAYPWKNLWTDTGYND